MSQENYYCQFFPNWPTDSSQSHCQQNFLLIHLIILEIDKLILWKVKRQGIAPSSYSKKKKKKKKTFGKEEKSWRVYTI